MRIVTQTAVASEELNQQIAERFTIELGTKPERFSRAEGRG
jgi:hypothetical protein